MGGRLFGALKGFSLLCASFVQWIESEGIKITTES